jgi:1,5-anhydro-D-fructose reductase (1,5-anhydro-D-mannitol-forming)
VTSERLGVGIAGFWHVHAVEYAREVMAHPGTRLVAGWDADAAAGREGAAGLDIAHHERLDDFLSQPDLDAITVTTATAEHTEVISRAIEAGKHVFSEKLLAPTVAESRALADAARRRGVALVVSLPQLSEPTIVAASDLIASGALGDVTYARVRMAHDGWLDGWLPERFADPVAAVGGAFADLGCHPAYVIQRLLGARPAEVTAAYGHVTDRPVEDNAVVVARYGNGALGVAEASFVTTPGAFAFEVRGTEASLLCGFGREDLIGKGGRLGDEWTVQTLGEGGRRPFELWVDAMRGAHDAADNVEAAIDLTRLVVAANKAAATGVAVPYDLEEDQ